MGLRFEWDEAKNQSNIRKHGVSFEEAARVFEDPAVLTYPELMDGTEQRWQSIGLVRGVLLLFVAHTVRDNDGDEIIRMISARRAERRERRKYEEG